MNCDSAIQLWGLVLTQPKREVLRAYLDCANEDGVSSPVVQQIAWMTDYHERHVQRLTQALVADGLLEPTPRAGKTTEYRFNLAKAAVKPALGEGVTFVTPDIQRAPHEMSPLTSESTPDSLGGDIQIAPHAPAVEVKQPTHERAGAVELVLQKQEIQKQELKDKNTTTTSANRVGARETLPERPNAFVLYEQNIGILTPLIGNQIKDAIADYSAAWVEEAIGVAVENNVRKWSYIAPILERWQRDGKNTPRPASVKGQYPARAAPQAASANGHAPPPSTSAGAPALRPVRKSVE